MYVSITRSTFTGALPAFGGAIRVAVPVSTTPAYEIANTLLRRAVEEIKVNPELRLGQAVWAVSADMYPGETDGLRATSLDPFNNDNVVVNFLTALATQVSARHN
jgi:hypothetical protein